MIKDFPTVLILVLLELSLWAQAAIEFTHDLRLVLILVLLELSLWELNKQGLWQGLIVLILVLLELSLWELPQTKRVQDAISLNPCFTGT